MKVVLVKPAELGPDEARLWARFQQTSRVTLNPFLSLAFAQAVGRARSSARVAVVEEGGKIEAFLPFELVGERIAVPIGWPMNDLQGFIWSGSSIDPRSVIRKAQLRGWRFDHAPTEQGLLAPHHYRGTTIQCPVMDLTEGYQSYIKTVRSKSKTVIAKSGRQKRALERELGAVWVEWNSSCPEHFSQLIAWKSAQYQRMNTRQLFSDPTALRIVDQLARAQGENCSGIVTVLHAGERPVAINLGILGPTRSERVVSGIRSGSEPFLAWYDDVLCHG